MEIYVKMNEEELEEFKEYKKTKEIKTCFNDDNVINYIVKRYKEIEKRDLQKYYNIYSNRSAYTDHLVPFDLVSGNKMVRIDEIEITINK